MNIEKRFKENFPDLCELVSRSTFTIDHLHVQNHIDKCMYLFSSVYKDGIGHFPAIANEQYWSESNQFGPQIRQMNPGHREDKLTSNHHEWNDKKEIKFCKSVINIFINILILYLSAFPWAGPGSRMETVFEEHGLVQETHMCLPISSDVLVLHESRTDCE